MLSEAPEGRKLLENLVEDIQDRTDDPDSMAVMNAAQIAMRVITWKP